MLDSAYELFIADGYAATTMERIANRAEVAVQTLYYSFRTKGQLLCELVEVAAAGTDDVLPVAQRPWMRELMAATSAQRVLALTVEHGTGIYERAAPLWPAVNAAAAADPEVGQYWQGVTANRRAGQARLVGRLAELGALREGLDAERATDLVVVLGGHDVYRGLVVEAGWPLPGYKTWLFTTLVEQLLGTPPPDPEAFEGLSFQV
jgi:AcrR family transcriptional regulator